MSMSSGAVLICVASMLLGSAIFLMWSPAAYGHNTNIADPNDPIGSENRVMLIQVSSFMFCVLLVLGIVVSLRS